MRRQRRKNIEAVKYALTLPRWMNEARRHPSWPAMKKEWQEHYNRFMDHEKLSIRRPIILDEAKDWTEDQMNKILGEMPFPVVLPSKNVIAISSEAA